MSRSSTTNPSSGPSGGSKALANLSVVEVAVLMKNLDYQSELVSEMGIDGETLSSCTSTRDLKQLGLINKKEKGIVLLSKIEDFRNNGVVLSYLVPQNTTKRTTNENNVSNHYNDSSAQQEMKAQMIPRQFGLSNQDKSDSSNDYSNPFLAKIMAEKVAKDERKGGRKQREIACGMEEQHQQVELNDVTSDIDQMIDPEVVEITTAEGESNPVVDENEQVVFTESQSPPPDYSRWSTLYAQVKYGIATKNEINKVLPKLSNCASEERTVISGFYACMYLILSTHMEEQEQMAEPQQIRHNNNNNSNNQQQQKEQSLEGKQESGELRQQAEQLASKHIEALISIANQSDNPHIQFLLALFYDSGLGLGDKDTSSAIQWYQKAVQGEHAGAQCALGVMYFQGVNGLLNKDLSKAFKLSKSAAEEGRHPGAQCNLGRCYENGFGVEIQLEKAAEFYKLSAEQGNMIAQNNLGVCLEKGRGVTRNIKEAVKWYTIAADRGYSRAQYNLGLYYQNILLPGDRGYDEAIIQSRSWYEKASTQNNSKALNNLGVFYDCGFGVQQDWKKAFELFQQSAELGDVRAQFNVGLCYAKGKGVGKNASIADTWYKRAKENGYEVPEFALSGVSRSESSVSFSMEAANKAGCNNSCVIC